MVVVGASPTTQTNSRIRLALLLGFGLATLLVIATLVKYPGTGQTQAQYLILGIVQIVFLLVAGAVIALLVTRNRSVGGNRVMRTSIFVGVLLGLLWVVEINYNNLLTPPIDVRDPVDNVFWAAIALGIFVLALLSALRTRSFLQGVQSGFWSGTASGLIACLMGQILVVFFIALVTHDPVSIQEWNDLGASSGAPNITTYFAYETLTGAFLHLFGLGTVMGLLLGAIGGSVGKSLSLILHRA